MIIGERLRDIREHQQLLQSDLGKRAGLFESYISRVENGRIIPSLETLEKLSRALQVPLYSILDDGNRTSEKPRFPSQDRRRENKWGAVGKDARYLRKLRILLAKMTERDRALFLIFIQNLSKRQG